MSRTSDRRVEVPSRAAIGELRTIVNPRGARPVLTFDPRQVAGVIEKAE
jgi:hypothetical protein